MSLNVVFFFLLAVGAIATAVTMLTRKNPVSAAVFLIAHFCCLSGLYLTLQAQVLALLQILVYAGAIMVLVVFVIMLLNLGHETDAPESSKMRGLVALTVAGLLGIQIVAPFFTFPGMYSDIHPAARTNGTIEVLGKRLFTEYIFPFEAISLLLLAAIIGAVMIGRRFIQQQPEPHQIKP